MSDKVSFQEQWEREKPVDYDDTVDKRLDFVASICRDDDGQLVENAEIHRVIQTRIFEWEQNNIQRGMVRVPYGVGKSTQITQALNLYHLTLNPNHLIILLSGKPSNAKARVDWLRDMIEHNSDYRKWCNKHGLKPVELSHKDTGSTRKIFVKRSTTSPHPSVFGAGVNEGGTGWRATRLTPDDIVDRKNSRYKKERDNVDGNWKETWSQRVKPDGFVHGVFTPYHPKDANMRMVDSGNYAELKIRVSENKTHYELQERRPFQDEDEALIVDTGEIPLWVDGGHDTQYYEFKEDEDETAYKRGFEMQEDVVEEGDKAYPHYEDELYPDGNITNSYDYQRGGASVHLIVDFNYDPQCWSLGQRQGNKHIIFDEIRQKATTTKEMAKITADKLLDEWNIRFVRIIGDATPRKGREGYSDYDTIKDVFSDKGIRYVVKTGVSNPSQRNSITHLNKGLCDTKGRRHILIHDRCKWVKKDLRKTERDENGKIADKGGDLTHFSDGLRYFYWYVATGHNEPKLPKLRG